MEFALDTTTGEYIGCRLFNNNDLRFFDAQKIRLTSKSEMGRYRCPVDSCQAPVWLAANPHKNINEYALDYIFRHKNGTGKNCPLSSDSEMNRAEIHKGIQEGNNHLYTKLTIATLLQKIPDWEVISVDDRFVFNEDRTVKGKPDILARYRGQEVAIEIQLHSEDPAVLMARHSLYKGLGYGLLFISIDTPIGDEDELSDGVRFRQVHKDIATIQKGNWFQFTKDDLVRSIDEKQFCLTVIHYASSVTRKKPELKGTWVSDAVSFNQLTVEPGLVYYIDSESLLKSNKFKYQAWESPVGRKIGGHLLKQNNYRSYQAYLDDLKSAWPAFNLVYEVDVKSHQDAFNNNYRRRARVVGDMVLNCAKNFFAGIEPEASNELRRISKACVRKGLDFGLDDPDIQVISHLLCVLGFPLYSGKVQPLAAASASAAKFLDAKDGAALHSGLYALPLALELSNVEVKSTNAIKKRITTLKEVEASMNGLKPFGYSRFVQWIYDLYR